MNHWQRVLNRCAHFRFEYAFARALLEFCPEIANDYLVPGVGHVVHQYNELRYKIDFAFIGERARIAVEVDEQHHRNQQTLDAQRDEGLRQAGWLIVRFNDKRVAASVTECVKEVVDLAKKLNRGP
jgi:very-short-patch-repair endonuclease